MTRLERHRQKLEELISKRNELARTMNLVKASALNDEIAEIQRLIAQCEAYEAKPLKELISHDEIEKSGIIPAMIECHLAADFIAYCTYGVEDIIKKMGLHYASIIPELKQIRKLCNDFASRLCTCSEDLNDLLIYNDTLVEALHKKCCSYMTQRLSEKNKSKE